MFLPSPYHVACSAVLGNAEGAPPPHLMMAGRSEAPGLTAVAGPAVGPATVGGRLQNIGQTCKQILFSGPFSVGKSRVPQTHFLTGTAPFSNQKIFSNQKFFRSKVFPFPIQIFFQSKILIGKNFSLEIFF